MTQIGGFLSSGTTRHFQPSPDRAGAESPLDKRLASLVGLVAFGLPVVLAIGAWLGGGCFRDSISHFYYAQFLGPVMVGMLCFIGGFLIAYTGEHWLEDFGSTVAGLGAFGVAVFPASGSGCEQSAGYATRVFTHYTEGAPPVLAPVEGRGYFQLFERVEHLHAWAAGILLAYLGLYCLVVLRRVVPGRHVQADRLIATKHRRNLLYTICGATILCCVALMGWYGLFASKSAQAYWNARNLTFLVEMTALWAFGLAWIAKGRRLKWFNDA